MMSIAECERQTHPHPCPSPSRGGKKGGDGSWRNAEWKKINPKSEVRNPQSNGFTLLEVMVAVTIMAMVLVALLGLKNRSMQDVALAEHITMATMLANGKMLDTIKSRNFDPVEEEGEYPARENLTEYTWKRTITKIPLPNGSFLTEIHVATLWKEGTRPETVELVDYE
jgi:type II secretion system protein I